MAYKIGEYEFATYTQAEIAKKELAVINNWKNKYDLNNPNIAKRILNGVEQKNIFKTKLGLDFVESLRYTVYPELLQDDHNDEDDYEDYEDEEVIESAYYQESRPKNIPLKIFIIILSIAVAAYSVVFVFFLFGSPVPDIVGRWTNEQGWDLTFEKNGSFTNSNTNENGRFTLISDAIIEINIDNRVNSVFYSIHDNYQLVLHFGNEVVHLTRFINLKITPLPDFSPLPETGDPPEASTSPEASAEQQ